MNTLQLHQKLLSMSDNSEFHKDIINVIIRYYLTMSGYYEEHAVATFQKFLDSNILSFN
jgi:hypothetical protein